MDLIDTHCHLNFKAFKSDFFEVAQRSRDRGVKKIIIVGSDSKTSEDAIKVTSEINNACLERSASRRRVERVIASDSPAGEERGNLTQQGHPELACSEFIESVEGSFAYAAAGIHPIHTKNCHSELPPERYIRAGVSESVSDFAKIEQLAEDPRVVAIGESGLDFYHDKERKTEDEQIELFKKHIELAISLNKPLIVHNRLADDEVKVIIEQYPALKKAVFHCFSTDHNFAAWAIDGGFLISFTGNITYGNKKLKKVIEKTPIERIMVETDAPYMVPEPLRSQGVSRCEPYMCAEVIKKIASVKGISEQDLGEQIFKNSREFFGLS